MNMQQTLMEKFLDDLYFEITFRIGMSIVKDLSEKYSVNKSEEN